MFHCRMCNRPFEGFTDKIFAFTCANCGFKEKFSASGKRLEYPELVLYQARYCGKGTI